MDQLSQFHHRLLDAVRERPQGAAPAPTIGEIYQNLVPYRSLRSELGIWELAEYEHILLRLLSGEGGYVTVEDPHVRDEINRELASPNPILGIYRDYPGVTVRIGSSPGIAPGVAPPVATAAPVPGPGVAPEAAEPHDLPVIDAVPPPEAPAAEPGAGGAPSRPCATCGTELPEVAGVRFCPSCGSDQEQVACAGCGTTLRAEWNFCIRCGQRRADRPAGA